MLHEKIVDTFKLNDIVIVNYNVKNKNLITMGSFEPRSM